MLENIRLSFQGIWEHKLRSLLTMLGIIIGIAAIIAIVSTIKGTSEQIRKNLIGSGTNTVNVRLTESGDWDYEMAYSGIPSGIPVLDEEMRERISEMDHVEDATLYTIRTAVDYIYYNATAMQGGQLIGADSHYLNTCDEFLTKAESGEPVREALWVWVVSYLVMIIFITAVCCIISGIICYMLLRGMKTVSQKVEANKYIAEGGLQLTERYDQYTHTTETRTQIRKESSSGGSTRSESGGGGSGRSGKF